MKFGWIRENVGERTVDGDGHDFGQDEAIGADEGWDAVQRVQLEVLLICDGTSSVDKLDVEFVGFGDSKQNGGSGIALRRSQSLRPSDCGLRIAAEGRVTYLVAIELSERHFESSSNL